MDEAKSYKFFKAEIKEWVLDNFPSLARILDVGAGCGTYYNLLGDKYKNIDCVEIYKPNIDDYRLREKYVNVYNQNIIGFEYDFYDLIIFGDVLEHLEIGDAQRVLDYALPRCINLIVAVPFLHRQEPNENIYEKHLQADLTPQIMEIRYPKLNPLYQNELYGYYVKSWRNPRERYRGNSRKINLQTKS